MFCLIIALPSNSLSSLHFSKCFNEMFASSAFICGNIFSIKFINQIKVDGFFKSCVIRFVAGGLLSPLVGLWPLLAPGYKALYYYRLLMARFDGFKFVRTITVSLSSGISM
jgi:hypothetical protein